MDALAILRLFSSLVNLLVLLWWFWLINTCSVAGLELGSVVIGSEILTHILNFINASASIWPVFVNLGLEFSRVAELSSSEVSSSNKVVDVDTTVESSASQSIKCLDHVLGQGWRHLGKYNGDHKCDNVEDLSDKVCRSANNAIYFILSCTKIFARGAILSYVKVERSALARLWDNLSTIHLF